MTLQSPSDSDRAVIDDEMIRERVRSYLQENEQKRTSSAVERWSRNEVVRLVLTFVLTGLLGTTITRCYQEKDEAVKQVFAQQLASDARLAAARASQRTLQLIALDSVGSAVNETYYAFTRYYDGISKGRAWPLDTTEKRRLRARAKLDSYFNRQMSIAARICALFGARSFHSFIAMDSTLRDADASLATFAKQPDDSQNTWVVLQRFQDHGFHLLAQMASIAGDTLSKRTGDCGTLAGPNIREK
jgi:hypothetical protein